ncbi:hypothetical protein J3458_002829 [Metarhizium acridum]|uniref:uncharacterized protein n=1 Tax=Metarhizium acridum TaxID=92637 RepID=UPI001C6BA3C7|nr:hypothetical protein J3458_002829 [Metarhizium acridum]
MTATNTGPVAGVRAVSKSSSSVCPSPTVVGNGSNYWLFTNNGGFAMTHPETPSSPPECPPVTLKTINSPVTIFPAKTALVIIDMQNFFLSAAMGRSRG